MPVTYVEDIVAAEPKFGFDLIAGSLTTLLTQPSQGALVVGLHGAWGAGKSTMMRAIRVQLTKRFPANGAVFIEFNAWKFQDRQALWRALILHVLGELRRAGGKPELIDELEQALYRAFAVEEKGPWKINWQTAIVEVIGVLLSALRLGFVANAFAASRTWFSRIFVGTKGDDDRKKGDAPLIDKDRVQKLAAVLERTTVERHVAQVQSVEQFIDVFRRLMAEFAPRRVFVFIDDLDRCLPESALEIFEAIKLFLDSPGCGYVVALDRDVIRKGLDIKYSSNRSLSPQGFIDPDEYIEKTISLSYDLPRLSAEDAIDLFDDVTMAVALTPSHKKLIVDTLGTNPRRIRRFANTLAVQLNLAYAVKASGGSVPAALTAGESKDAEQQMAVFLKLLMLSYRYSGVMAHALDDPLLLGRLQRASNKYVNDVATAGSATSEILKVRGESLNPEIPLISALHGQEGFWRLMRAGPNLADGGALQGELLGWFRAQTKT